MAGYAIWQTTKVITATGIPVIDGVLGTVAWNDPIIYYTVSTLGSQYSSPYSEADTFNQISAMQETAADWILNTSSGNLADDGFSVEGFTNLGVTKTTNTGSHIRYGESDEPSTAWAYYPSTHKAGGDVWFGTTYNYRSPEAGNYAWATLIHETGHALGLRHGHESGGHGALPAMYDAMEVSIMTYRSYIGGPTTGYTNETWGFAQTFMIADIAALQEMYGADYTTNSGDTVYKWDPASGDTLVNGSVGIDAGGNRIFATIWDGGGIDTYDLSAYSTDLTLDLSPGWYSYFNFSQIAYLGNSNYAHGNIYNAMMHDGNTASLIENAIGGTGDDTIIGNQVVNHLMGGAGNDFLRGGLGADTLNGGVGIDTADYSDSLVGVDIGTFRIGTGGTAQGDHLIYMEHIIGSDFADTLVGGGPAAILDGMDGNDILFDYGGSATMNGGVGNDFIQGGYGADIIDGGTGIDTISYAQTGSVNINLLTGVGTGFNAEGDTFVNVENVIGSNAADVITGDANNNIIKGLNGSDTIKGGGGNDSLYGGGNADTFVFDTTTFGNDVIYDFQDNWDKIDLSGSGLTFADFTVVDTAQGVRLDYFNGTDTVTISLLNIDPAQLTASDFIV